MKKIFQIALITTIFAFSSLKAYSAVMSASEIKSVICQKVADMSKDYTDAQLQVSVTALPFKELDLPEGQVTFVVKPSAEKFMARDLEKIDVYVNGKLIKSFNAPVVVKAYQDVLVASCYITREQAITKDVVKVKRIEVSNTIGYQLRPDAVERELVAKKVFVENEVIDKRFVKLRPDVLRNAVVTVQFNSNNLTISTDAKALSDGAIGENICVMNKNYNKIYTGKVIGENKVLVKI